ncbi:iron donor protein CyaY [Halopseudomonas phragmitis]|uniref:Iron donor protein CyaY n=2 Tax=Pseudomonadaceae TaxID=135621 RepID=A0A1V0B297_9GAMM|nr:MULTISPECIES: iron donor protein CyaY [Pseudomonadaceae]AQZ94052.1 iron donor protein CyaY [Halopseudomonas phragmitis]PAU86826.1 iron donor protein CyaY [Pseudomonas sp. WN033]RHW20638.1 iron donor protein CyaY [Pseudomonas jilinensis]
MYELSEAEFHREVDRILDRLEHALDDCGLDIDMEQDNGHLQIHLNDGPRLVLGRQPASRELWLATPETTLHFGFEPGQGWQHDGGDESLGELLGRLLSEFSGEDIELQVED